MIDQIQIRQETQVDFNDIFALNHKVFGQDSEAKLVDALRSNQTAFIPSLSLVATYNHTIVGHILFTKLSIEDDKGALHESLGLAPMAVRPAFQQCGIGGQLIRKGFEVAKELSFKSVIVLGHEKYYPKFGFQPADKWNIKAPFDVPSNVFMAIELVTDGLKNIAGTVVYPKEFEIV